MTPPSSQAAQTTYRFSFGPWNISTGADPFGPTVRQEMEYAAQAPGLQGARLRRRAVPRRRHRPGRPRLAEHAEGRRRRSRRCSTARGSSSRSSPPGSGRTPGRSTAAFTSNSPADRQYAIDRAKRCRRHRPRGRLQEHRPLAGPRGDVHPRGQGRQDGRRPDRRRLERHPRARPGDPHARRDEAQRADGPGLPADGRPHDGRRLQDDRPRPRRRPDRDAPTRSWPASTRPTTWPSPSGTASSGAST